MFDFLSTFFHNLGLAYVVSTIVSVKHYVVDDTPDTPNQFWISVAILTVFSTGLSFFIK